MAFGGPALRARLLCPLASRAAPCSPRRPGSLPVAPLPKIEAPAIFVSASLPGASPEVMASSVATPLERHLGAIADVDDMTSRSSVGSTNIQLTFGLDRDIDGASSNARPSANNVDFIEAYVKEPRCLFPPLIQKSDSWDHN